MCCEIIEEFPTFDRTFLRKSCVFYDFYYITLLLFFTVWSLFMKLIFDFRCDIMNIQTWHKMMVKLSECWSTSSLHEI